MRRSALTMVAVGVTLALPVAGASPALAEVPGAPNMPDLQASSDDGVSSTDNRTTIRTPLFDLSGLESDATVTVHANDAVLFTVVVPTGSSFVTGGPSVPMAPGEYVITATQTNASGTSAHSAPMVPNLVIEASTPVSRNDCYNGGWRTYGYKNQGQCVKAVR